MLSPRALVLGCALLFEPSLASESALTKYEQEFRTWMKDFGVAFHNVESFFERFHIFSSNAHFIDSHNENADVHGYTLKHNAFSNLTWSEFRESYFGLSVPEEYVAERNARQRVEASFLAKYKEKSQDLPDTIDWVEKGGVSPVKNQGQCGSCWAFSTTGAIEGAAFVSGQKLENLSEQELVDCDHADMGCNGGLMDHAFYWVEKHGGMCSEKDYAYHATAGKCRHSGCENVVEVETFHDVPGNDEQALKLAVSQQPVAVAIEADQRAFQFYSSGVFTAACGAKLDHGVLAVGYGTLDGTKYWKVKNSWGPKWGLDGYILLERDVDAAEGQCGIAAVPSYPKATIVSKKEKSTTPAISTSTLHKSAAVFDLDRVLIPKGPSHGTISQCGTTKVVDFSSFDMNPTTPLRGKPIEIVAKGLSLKAFDAVNFKLSVKLGGVEVYSSNGNMCGATHIPLPLGLGHIDMNGFHCPVAKGPFPQVGLKVLLPLIAPAGDYEIAISGTSPQDGVDIFCIGVKLDLAYEDETSYFPNQVYQIMANA